jgi:hypothetical protein
MSGQRIAEALEQDYDKIYDDLKNLRNMGQVRREGPLWYWCGDSIVPEGVTVRRKPPTLAPYPERVIDPVLRAQPLEEKVDIQTLPMPEPTELGKVAMVPTAELEKPAVDWDDRDEMPEIRIELQIPTWVARRVMDVLEQASRESKAAGRLWGTET